MELSIERRMHNTNKLVLDLVDFNGMLEGVLMDMKVTAGLALVKETGKEGCDWSVVM